MKEKLTKKKLIIILSSTAASILLLIALFAACSTLSLPSPSEEESESGTVRLPTHLGQDETDSEKQNLSNESESSEEDHSSQIAESDSSGSETLNTESAEDTSEESSSNEIERSLEFVSHGNGTCSVAGIGSVVDAYIVIPLKSPDGDVVTSISEKAFYGNATIRAIEIPSTVSYIGDMAFSDCSQLVYISVDKDNRSFTDVGGILFSADMTCLVAYPSANGASAISLPAGIVKIAPMAFYNCAYLKTINYEGSAEQWSKINIGQMNYGLYSASIIFEK